MVRLGVQQRGQDQFEASVLPAADLGAEACEPVPLLALIQRQTGAFAVPDRLQEAQGNAPQPFCEAELQQVLGPSSVARPDRRRDARGDASLQHPANRGSRG